MALDELVHQCPPSGESLTPCCRRTPFELPRWSSRITIDAALVTCSGPRAAREHEAEQRRETEEAERAESERSLAEWWAGRASGE